MSEAKFVIIEDDVTYIHKYRAFLERGGVRAGNIWPPKSGVKPLENARWISVTRELELLKSQGWDPTEDMVILILDLALNDEGNPDEGTALLEGSTEFFERYVRLVISNSADSSTDRLGGKVDGLLAKRDIDSREEFKGGASFGSHRFWSAIRSASAGWSSRTGRSSPLPLLPTAKVVGSELSVGLFRSRFGEQAINEVAQYASDRHESIDVPEVTVADGGFSGAAVLLLAYRARSGKRALALKISESEGFLVREAKAASEAVAASAKFGYAFQGLQGPERIAIGGKTLYVTNQVFVDGRTLEDFVLSSDESSFGRMLRSLEDLLGSITSNGLSDASRRSEIHSVLEVPENQRLRFERCIQELESFWLALQVCTPDVSRSLGLSKGSFRSLVDVARNWSSVVCAAFPTGVLQYEQHGDLHARNIMVLSERAAIPQLKFIDAARFGSWPALYDLCRLKLNLAVRLLDTSVSGLDHIPQRMVLWESHWLSRISSVTDDVRGTAKSARRFALMAEIIASVIETQQKGLGGKRQAERLVALCEAFDLFKMVCYLDLSTPKRLWLAARLHSAIQRLQRK